MLDKRQVVHAVVILTYGDGSRYTSIISRLTAWEKTSWPVTDDPTRITALTGAVRERFVIEGFRDPGDAEWS